VENTQQIEKLEKKVGSLQMTVSATKISDQGTYDRAVVMLTTIKEMQNDPNLVQLAEAKLDAHALHKKLSDLFNRVMDPLKSMEQILKNKLLTWDRAKQAEEDRKKREAEEKRQAAIRAEQKRLDDEARKKADAAAAQAKKDGESKAAQERARKAAEDAQKAENSEKIAAMTAAPTPETKPSYERSAAVQTRDNWQWEFQGGIAGVLELVKHVAANPSDLYLLEPEKLIELHPNLNKLAKAQKTMMTIPGGRAVNQGTVAASSR
jgi:hypothetical protein